MKMQLYNENSFFNAHTKLQSTPVTIDVDPVGISVPSGALRLNYDKPFTHIQFELSGEPYICKITNVKNLGGDLNEYSYTIDYLKDYVNKYGLLNQDIVIGRSTAPELWRKMVVDNQFPRGSKMTYTRTNYGAVLNNYSIMLVINYPTNYGVGYANIGKSVYVIDSAQWGDVQATLLSPRAIIDSNPVDIAPEFLYSAIDGVYIIPSPDMQVWNSGEYYDIEPTTTTIPIYARNGTGSGAKVVSGNLIVPEGVLKRVKIKSGECITISRPVTDAIDTLYDWRDIELKRYVGYAPFYGGFEINPQNFTGVYYKISPSNGTIAISTTVDGIGDMLNAVPLPQLPYVTDSTITSQHIINQQTQTSIAASAIQAGLSIAVGAVGAATGNVMLTAGGVLGAVSSVGSAAINAGASQANAMYAQSQTALTYSQNSGSIGLTLNQIQIVKCDIEQPLSMTEFAERYGYYADYKITDTIPDSVLTKRCWLDLHGARLRGADWYASGARAALDGACIIID